MYKLRVLFVLFVSGSLYAMEDRQLIEGMPFKGSEVLAKQVGSLISSNEDFKSIAENHRNKMREISKQIERMSYLISNPINYSEENGKRRRLNEPDILPLMMKRVELEEQRSKIAEKIRSINELSMLKKAAFDIADQSSDDEA